MMIDLPIRRGYEGPNRVSTCQFLRMRPLWLNYEGTEKLTDFQVKCVLTPTDIPFEKLRTDKQDLLFVDNNNEPIPYWIEKADSTEIIVWLKFSEIIPGKEVFWLYYGNGNFSGVSNVSAIFIRMIDGLVGAWHLDEGSGNVAYDSSGQGNDGTIYGATWIDGKFGKALSFDGSDDYVDFGNDPTLTDVSDITIILWFSFTDIPTYDAQLIGVMDVWSNPSYYNIWIDNGSGYFIFRYKTSGDVWEVSSGAAFNDGQYHHIAAVRAGSEIKIFVDGVLKNSVSGVSGSVSTSESLKLCGKYESYVKGYADEVFVFNKALSDEEISDLYNNYGYTTTNYPGKVLVKKYTEPEPFVSL
ncbi:MAG: hypothetical protein DRP08_06800 [Candidatus Aenigmatarchaeota archaeon]|nr:MAG: hypothetical protein DRP08_06800 [Candidatus Aenigmarchaeota archaeon]